MDVELLKKQRDTLLEIIQCGNQTAQVVEHLDGLINFLDDILCHNSNLPYKLSVNRGEE